MLTPTELRNNPCEQQKIHIDDHQFVNTIAPELNTW